MSLISIFAIGVREECFFRAIIQNILAKKYANTTKGVWLTAIVSALIFGLIHAFNVFSGVNALSAIIQAVTNVGLGLFYGAVYLRCKNIWALISIHALTDTVGLFASIFTTKSEIEIISTISWPSLIIGVAFIAISIFLLRPSKCKEIVEGFKSTNS